MPTGNITQQPISDEFNKVIRPTVYNSIVWHLGNAPSGVPSGWLLNKSSLPSMSSSSIDGTNPIGASRTTNSCVNFCINYYSGVRKLTHIHRYRGNSSAIISQETQMAYTSQTQSISSSIGISQGQIIDLPTFDSLLSAWRTASNNAISYTTYQHTSHSSHGSRARR